MISFLSGNTISISGINFPMPGADGAIPVSKDGQWSVGVDKDPKANSLEAATQLSANEFTGNYINVENIENSRGIVGIPDGISATDVTAYSGTGGGIALQHDGIYIRTGNTQHQLTREDLIILLTTVSGSSSYVDPLTNGGRLVVTPAYMNTAGASSLQLNSANKWVMFGWTQEVAHEIPAVSIHFADATSLLRASGGLYLADNNGDPTGDAVYDLFDAVTFTPPGSTPGWGRIELTTPPQGLPGTRYVGVIKGGGDGTDFSLSYNRQDAGQTSGLVSGCWSKTGTIEAYGDFSTGISSQTGSLIGLSVRVPIPANVFDVNANKIRLRFQASANPGNDTVITHAAIVEQSGGGSGGTTTPTQLFFGGNAGITIIAGTGTNLVDCDDLEFFYDHTKSYLVIMDYADSGNTEGAYNPSYSTAFFYKTGATYNEQTPADMITGSNQAWTIERVTLLNDDVYIWTDLTKDGQPALLNVVIASTAEHCPQLVYGWTGKHGNKTALYIPDEDLAEAIGISTGWELENIPDGGLFVDMTDAENDVVSGVSLLRLPSPIGPIVLLAQKGTAQFQDGVRISDYPSMYGKHLGLVTPIIRVGAALGPIRCDTYNGLLNTDNQTRQKIFRQPFYLGDQAVEYMASNYEAIVNTWDKIGTRPAMEGATEYYTANVLTGCGSELSIVFQMMTGDYAAGSCYINVSIAINDVFPAPGSDIARLYGGVTAKSLKLLTKCGEGLQSIFPIKQIYADGGSIQWAFSYRNDTAPGPYGVTFSALHIEYMG